MTTNNSSTGFLPYGNSPGDSTSSTSSQSSAASASPTSSTPYLVDISGNSNSYSYLTGGMQTHHQQLQSIHQQQMQQQQWYNDQSLMAANQNPVVDGYLTMEAGRVAAAAAAVHHNMYAPLTQQQQQQPAQPTQLHQQGSSTGGAITTPASTSAAPNAPQSARGKSKRKHAGVDKKVYQATMKPIIERQRRARINSSLEELHNLLRLMTGTNLRPRQPTSPGDGDPSTASGVASSSSNNPRRIEKADILEQAVRFIKNLKNSGGNFQFSNSNMPSPSTTSNGSNASNIPSTSSQTQQNQPHREPSPNSQQPSGLQLAAIQQAFCAGYAECTRLTTSWLATHQECEKASRHGGTSSHDDSHLSANDPGEDHDSDSMVDDDDGDGFLGSDEEEQEVSSNSKIGSGMGQQLRAKLEDHLISRLNERLTAHISKCLPPASAVTGGRAQGQLIPTPPQSPKDLLLPFLTNGAGIAVGPNGVAAAAASSSNATATYNQNLMSQQFSPISPFTAAAQQQQMQQQIAQQQSVQQTSTANNGAVIPQQQQQQQPCSSTQQPTVIYYDPMTQQQPSTSATAQQQGIQQPPGAATLPNNGGSGGGGLNPLMAEFMDTKDPVALNNAMMFNSFVAQLQQTQRAAAAAGLYCWRPWD